MDNNEKILAGLSRWAPAQVKLIRSKSWETPGHEYEFVCTAIGAVLKLGATREQAITALTAAGYEVLP